MEIVPTSEAKLSKKSRKTKFPRTRWLNFRIQPRICPLLRHIWGRAWILIPAYGRGNSFAGRATQGADATVPTEKPGRRSEASRTFALP